MGFLLEWEVKEKPRTTSTAKSWRGLQASYLQHTSSSGSTEYPWCDFSTCLYRFASKIDVLQTKYGWYKNIFDLYVHTVIIESRMCLKFCVDTSDTTDTSMYLMYPPDCPAVLADNTSRFPWIWRTTLAASWGSQGRRCLSNIQIRTKSAVRSGIQSGYPKW